MTRHVVNGLNEALWIELQRQHVGQQRQGFANPVRAVRSHEAKPTGIFAGAAPTVPGNWKSGVAECPWIT